MKYIIIVFNSTLLVDKLTKLLERRPILKLTKVRDDSGDNFLYLKCY